MHVKWFVCGDAGVGNLGNAFRTGVVAVGNLPVHLGGVKVRWSYVEGVGSTKHLKFSIRLSKKNKKCKNLPEFYFYFSVPFISNFPIQTQPKYFKHKLVLHVHIRGMFHGNFYANNNG